MTEADYLKYLTSVMECQQQQDPEIKHEWLIDDNAEAVRVANYLRGYGFTVVKKPYNITGVVQTFYVGVPFATLKNNI
jgi:hypothetical protein